MTDTTIATPDTPLILGSDAEVPAAPPQKATRGFLGPVLGGAVAAVAGFGLSHFNVLSLRANDALTAARLDSLAQETATLTSRLSEDQAAVSDRLAGLEAGLEAAVTDGPAAFDPSALEARMAAVEDGLAAIKALPGSGRGPDAALGLAITDLQQRVAALGAGAAVPADVVAKVDAALQRLADAEAKAVADAAAAEATAAAAARAAALRRLGSAMDSGAPYDTELAEVSGPPLPAAITGPAAGGLVTLAALQASFPDAARAALQADRAAKGDTGWGTRLADFLQAQTGARSLVPRAGPEVDAVLSRADAALRDGRLRDAVDELGGLDPAVSAPFLDWIAAANQRLAADAALAALTTSAAP